MSKAMHFFDPTQACLYTRSLNGEPIEWSVNALADLFYQLQQPEYTDKSMAQAYALLQQELQQVQQHYATVIMPEYSPAKLAALQVAKITPFPEPLCSAANLNTCLQQTTIVLATQPQWLQNISPAVASQSFIATQLLRLFLQLTRNNAQGIALPQAYQAMLLAQGITMPSLHSYNLSQQLELPADLLKFATVQLALAKFPRVFLPEILGFTLAYCQLPTLVEVAFPQQQLVDTFWQQRQDLLQQQIAPLLRCSTAYLDLFPQQSQLLWQRMQKGFYLYQLQMQGGHTQVHAILQKPFDRQQAVAKLLQHKVIAAMGHHQKIQLAGRSLEQWFSGLPDNTADFLQALMQSAYVDKQQPANSRLLQLFAFNGPMFGVLDQAEQDTLLGWLQEGIATPTTTHIEPIITSKASSVAQNIPSQNFKKLSTRELYYYLVNADLFPEALPTAKAKVRKLLFACRLFNPLPFKHYSHQQFDAYIKNIYQSEVASYQPLQGAPKISKAAYIWGFEQIAPLILIDGSWIQNSLALQDVTPEISDILFATYCDEVGNGQLAQNHPYIFQQLLDSLAIQVPPAYSQEFIEHKGFINSAFDMPVFMLALASFSVEFLPELLGLNMAIELSGLGKSYLRLVDDWNYWGIDPSIAKIHISIDNYASGHTFLAKKSIQIYMDDLQQSTSNTTILDSHWRRIYSGYAALRFVGGRFKFGLPFAYFVYKFKSKHGLE
ncbi:MAG: hypothetical protein methR_P3181 [Methyloprofundus sp.]|nr:MAG: hypothetical protein methR_P3181 [Methyloprofundus sp.]